MAMDAARVYKDTRYFLGKKRRKKVRMDSLIML